MQKKAIISLIKAENNSTVVINTCQFKVKSYRNVRLAEIDGTSKFYMHNSNIDLVFQGTESDFIKELNKKNINNTELLKVLSKCKETKNKTILEDFLEKVGMAQYCEWCWDKLDSLISYLNINL